MKRIWSKENGLTNIVIASSIALLTSCSLFAGVVIDKSTSINLEVVLPLFAFIVGTVWWLGKRFQKDDDRFTEIRHRFRRIEGALKLTPWEGLKASEETTTE